MSVWTRSGSVDRRTGSVLPASEDIEAHLPRKKSLGPTSNTNTSTARSLPARGWLWLFLVVNLFGVCGFIFTSVVYFPSASTAGVVEQAIKQGDVSLLEVSQPTPAVQPNAPSEQEAATITDNENILEKLAVSDEEFIDPALAIGPESVERKSKSPAPQEEQRLENIPTNPNLRGVKEPSDTSAQPLLPEVVLEEASSENNLVNIPVVNVGEEISQDSELDQSTDPLPVENLDAPLSDESDAFTSVRTTSSPTNPPTKTPAKEVEKNSMMDLIERMKMEMDAQLQPSSDVVTTEVSTVPSPKEQDLVHSVVSNDLHDDLKDHLTIWLRADEGVDIDNATECKSKGGSSCRVNGWTSRSNPAVRFDPFDQAQRPLWVPNATNSGHPGITFTCPMTSQGLLLHDSMTFFFVLSPTNVESGDTYLGQKFFGNSPYGQFLLHGGKPAYYTHGGLREIENIVSNGQFALVSYRIHRHSVEIRLNGLGWGPDVPEDESYLVRMSGNTAVSLGNVKGACDTNAFIGVIAEVLIYDSLLQDTQIDAVELYLRNKWQLKSPATTLVSPGIHANDNQDNGQPTVNLVDPPIREDVVEDYAQNKQQPRTFDPESVFEWKPSDELIQEIQAIGDGEPVTQQHAWNKAVKEKVEAIRNFRFGGDLLRSFIRNHRDDLVALRDDLFGQS